MDNKTKWELTLKEDSHDKLTIVVDINRNLSNYRQEEEVMNALSHALKSLEF